MKEKLAKKRRVENTCKGLIFFASGFEIPGGEIVDLRPEDEATSGFQALVSEGVLKIHEV